MTAKRGRCEALTRMLLFTMAIFFSNAGEGQEVTVKNGIITVNYTEGCDITAYNKTLKNITGTLPGLFYGHIRNDCGAMLSKYLITKPRCVQCDLYCPQNDILLESTHFWVPFSVSSMLGVITAIVAFLILKSI